MPVLVHLTSSRLFGGPERQMLGFGEALPADYQSIFVSFWEDGYCMPFLTEARKRGFESLHVRGSRFRPWAAVNEVENALRRSEADVLFCHGYKADMLGLWAARRAGLPVVSVSRGWTGETLRVRIYEALDRFLLRFMDQVVCVSEGQRVKVLRAGVPEEKTTVIRNSVRGSEHAPDPQYAARLKEMFPVRVERVIGAAGRLSPEKGFGVLVDSARLVLDKAPDVGFVLFGDGVLRPSLERQIAAHGMKDRFVLGGFRSDLSHFLPHFDIVVLPSFTEGLPNIALEACAAGRPVVATSVGGTPEIIVNDQNGYLVPPGDAPALARGVFKLLRSRSARRAMGENGRTRVRESFTFAGQSGEYQELLARLLLSTTPASLEMPAQTPAPR